ncbi:hypothetical protein PspLS_03256 [Pyricularia sp. CBS 133598]|nr:hypothetical protein PspLS_03256 [Pyricularia sp. CBS 133598]
MPSITRTLAFSALLAFANAQGVVLKAVGDKGESAPLQLDPKNPADNNFIADAEIRENIVNACGRTAAGNIDIGESSEINLSKNAVTSVKKGGNLVVTIKQGGANGAGPFDCDLDLTNNSNGLTGQTKLKTKEAKKGDNIEVTATMPNDLKCIGGSTGDLCMVRCRNKQNFGGCVAIKQSDTTPNVNTPENIKTAAALKGVLDQINQDQRDFKTTVNAIATASEKDQGAAVAKALVDANTANGVLKDQNTTRVAAPAAGAGAGGNNGNGGKKNNAKNNGKKNAKANGKKNAKANGNRGKKANAAGARGGKKNAKANANNNRVAKKNNKRELFREIKRSAAEDVEEVQVNAQSAAGEEFFDDEE